MVFLHGCLVVKLVEARDLIDRDGAWAGGSDPYACVKLDGEEIYRTNVISGDQCPFWNETITINIGKECEIVRVGVWDSDTCDDADSLGYVEIPAENLMGEYVVDWYPLTPEGGEPDGAHGDLFLYIRYTDVDELTRTLEVPDVPFPLRRGCRVTLFQDAHCGEDHGMPEVVVTAHDMPRKELVDEPDEGAKRKKRRRKHRRPADDMDDEDVPDGPGEAVVYRPRNAYEEIYEAILEAQVFVYITGWSVWTAMSLLREEGIPPGDEIPDDILEAVAPADPEKMTMGELLKAKSMQGVKVLMLLWNEKTSIDNDYITYPDGLMGTHDEETREYFEGTDVQVCLAFREGGDFSDSFIWTHHQKSVICDADALTEEDADDGPRRVIAFVGGLDLTNGRWDTPRFKLFRSLQSTHVDDFHNAAFSGMGVTQDYGPREPWHDIHGKVEGPIARDVLENFFQRWRKQSEDPDALFVPTEDDNFVSIDDEEVMGPENPDAWSVQLFRSIDPYVCEGIDDVDKSIQAAYIHQIRRARNFLYFENQYFLGSSQEWTNADGEHAWESLCPHEVPRQIAQRICAAIADDKRFAVYILLPMYPEGVPDSGTVQEILGWQFKTVSFMYRMIAEALQEKGSDAHPTDYLNFYTLVSRETPDGADAAIQDPPEEEGFQQTVFNTRRFMVYIHSKMFIADDQYVLLGSANINQRSMGGDRDSEIAVGCFQPHHLRRKWGGRLPRGRVHAFRRSLFAQHMNVDEECFLDPHSIECVHRVNEIAQANWETYQGDDVVDMDSHLVKYPYSIDVDGTVTSSVDVFPDSTGTIIGGDGLMLPNLLTV